MYYAKIGYNLETQTLHPLFYPPSPAPPPGGMGSAPLPRTLSLSLLRIEPEGFRQRDWLCRSAPHVWPQPSFGGGVKSTKAVRYRSLFFCFYRTCSSTLGSPCKNRKPDCRRAFVGLVWTHWYRTRTLYWKI